MFELWRLQSLVGQGGRDRDGEGVPLLSPLFCCIPSDWSSDNRNYCVSTNRVTGSVKNAVSFRVYARSA